MKRYRIILLLLPLFLVACTKTIQVNTPHVASKLVINSSTYTGDTITMRVSKSVDVKDYKYGSDLNVPDAIVKLFVNGAFAENMVYDTERGSYISNVIAEKDKEYSVEISAPNFETVTASTKVPEQVDIIEVKRTKKVKIYEGVEMDELRISFNDPSTNGDHYVLSMFGVYVSPNPEDSFVSFTDCVYTSDPSVESIYNSSLDVNTCYSSDRIFFNDILYNGKQKEIVLTVSNSFLSPFKDPDTGELVYPGISLYHITDEYFKYLKSYQYALDNEGNPFAEPTNAYTNVKNGYGMFSISSHDSEEIK